MAVKAGVLVTRGAGVNVSVGATLTEGVLEAVGAPAAGAVAESMACTVCAAAVLASFATLSESLGILQELSAITTISRRMGIFVIVFMFLSPCGM